MRPFVSDPRSSIDSTRPDSDAELASVSDMAMVAKPVTPRRRRFQRGSLQKRKSGGCWNWIAFWWEDGHRRGQLLGPCSTMSRPEALAEMGKRLQSVNAHAGEVRPRVWTL